MNRSHEPLFLESNAENGIVIFIHGFMGSPRQFDKLAEAVHKQGFSAASLLLPGHGGTAKDFATGTFERWQTYVDAEIERLSRDYKYILLAGHSMGALLSINAAAKYCAHVRGIFTIACPFKITMFSAYTMKVRIKQFFSKKDDPVKVAYLSNSSVTPSPGIIWNAVGPSAEVKKLTSAALEKLPEIRVPVTAVYSSSDELTSIESLGMLSSGLSGAPFEQVLLSDSLHAYYPEHEYAMIENALLKLLSRTTMNENPL